MRYTLIVPTLLLSASLASAQGAPNTGGATNKPHAIVAVPGTIKWGPAPALLPAGAQLAVLEGEPAKAGPFTMRLRVPDGYRIPPHYHPVIEHVTVVQGTFLVGMGERFDTAKLTELPTGTFAALEPGVRHFAQARGETILQIHGIGPWSLTYVNPADDPRARSK
jgi:quercetin dioxygenase-like cupin family protein